MSYEVFAEFPIEQITPLISTNQNERVKIEGFSVRVGSTRLQTMGRSQKCVACNREGVVFRLERTRRAKGLSWNPKSSKVIRNNGRERHPEYKYGQTPHFNLYAIEYVHVKGSNRRERRYILMTRDHIYPHSKGGPDSVDNSQTMCERCNVKKSDKVDIKYILQKPVQEMLKSIPVNFPLVRKHEPCVNF